MTLRVITTEEGWRRVVHEDGTPHGLLNDTCEHSSDVFSGLKALASDALEDDAPLEPGDRCDDCETIIASDGECECNQDDDDA